MTKIKNLRKVLLLCALLLAIVIGSLFAIAQPQTAPTAHAEGETGATLTGKEKLAHVTLSDLFPTGYTAGDKIEIVDGDNEIGTLTVDKDTTSGFNGYVFKSGGLYTFKPNNEYNVKKFIYVAPTGGSVTFSLVGEQPSSTHMSIEKPTTAEKELINASFPDVKWDSYNAHVVTIDSSYYNDTQNPYVFKHSGTLKFGDIFLIYEETGNYTKTHDCTNDKNTSPATVKVGDATFLINYEGMFNNGYPAYGKGSFKITICPVPGYVINYVIFTSSIDNPFEASELKFPGLEATYENGNLTVTGMQPGQTYELFSGGSAQGLLTSITVNYIEHEHTGVYEPGSDETHHFDHCVCLWRVNEEEHTFGEGEITLEPTYQRKGKVKYTCAECGYEKEEQVAPNLADTEITSENLIYTGSTQFAKYTVIYKGQTLASWGSYYKASGTNSAKTPGTYTFTIIPKDGSIFEGEKEVTFTIEKGNYDMSAVVFEDMTVDYNGTEQSILATNLPTGVTATYEGNGQINAGVYTVTAKFTSNADDAQYYNPIANMTATLTINKATYDMSGISMAGKTVTYDGNKYSLAIEGTLPDGVDVSYDNNDKTDAGVYNVTANFTGNVNYNDIAPIRATLTIEKATYDMDEVVFADKTVTYNGSTFSIEATNLPSGVTASYENNGKTNAGEYVVTAIFTGNANYNDIANKTATLTIEQVVVTAPTADSTAFTYNGQAQTYALQENSHYTISTTTFTNAGNHTITVSLVDKTNYKWDNGNSDDLTYSFVIAKATYDMDEVVFANKTVTYNGSAFSIEATNLPSGVTASYENNGKTNAGEYVVTAIFTGNANYNDIAPITATLTINKATYDMRAVVFEDSTVTYNGTAFSIIATNLPTGVTATYEGNSQTVVGEYTITASFAGDATNYNAIAPITATLTIEKATYDMRAVVFEDSTVTYNGNAFSIIATNLPTGVTATYEGNSQTVVGVYTITASFAGDATNYNAIAPITATLTIEKATYDMSAVVFEDSTVTYNGSAFSIIATNLPTGVTATYEGNAQTVVGEYTITASFAGDATNYNAIADMTATLTINKATYDMSGISIANKTVAYDGQAHSIAIAGTLPTGVSVSYANNAKTEVGVYTVTASFAGDATNYNAISSMSAVLTIKAVVVENDLKDEKTGKPVVSIEKEDGFAPNTELEVSPFEEGKANAPVNITKKEEILGAYKLTLKQDDTDVDPDGTIVVKMLIPESALGRNFRIAHVQDGVEAGQVEYTIVNGYAVIETDELGEFVFVCEKDGLSGGAIAGIVIGSFFFLLILLFVVLFVVWKKFDVKPFAFLIPTYRKINKKFFNNELNDFEAMQVKLDTQITPKEEVANSDE